MIYATYTANKVIKPGYVRKEIVLYEGACLFGSKGQIKKLDVIAGKDKYIFVPNPDINGRTVICDITEFYEKHATLYKTREKDPTVNSFINKLTLGALLNDFD